MSIDSKGPFKQPTKTHLGYRVDAVSPGEGGKIAGLHVCSLAPGRTETYFTRAEVFHAMTEGIRFFTKRHEIFPVEIGERSFLRLQRDSFWRHRALRLGGNSHPEDHLVGLPERLGPPHQPEPSSQRSAIPVYLDQYVWSNFGKLLSLGRLGSFDMTVTWKAHLDELRSLVAEGIVVCPLSFAHCVELSNYDNLEVRDQMANLMIELSRGRCIPLVVIGLAQGRKPPLCNAVDMTPTERTYYLDDMRDLPPEVALGAYLRLLLSPEGIDLMRPGFRNFTKDVTVQLRRRSKGFFTTPLDPNPTVDVRWADEVFSLRLRDRRQKVKPGDPMDLLHLLASSATDIALLERSHTAMVRSAKFRTFRICDDIDDLLTTLRKVAETQRSPASPSL